MAIFTAINFLSVRRLAHTNSVATWWKVGDPGADDRRAGAQRPAHEQLHRGERVRAVPAPEACSRPSPRAGSCSRCSGFEQADQLAGESSNPKRDIPRAVIGSIVHRRDHLHPAAVRVPRSRCRRRRSARRGRGRPSPPSAARSRNSRRSSARAGWRRSSTSTPSISPGGHRADLHHRRLTRLLRAEPQRLRAGRLRADRRARRAVGRADHRVRRRLHLLPALPELALAGRADHERERADVRGRAAGPRRVRDAARRRAARTGCPPRACSRRSPSRSRTC